MTHTRFNPPAEWKPQIPPTEDDRTFRKRVIQGEVNDENASVMGGVAGHAGVFAPAIDIARFAECMLRGGAPIFKPETVQLFTRRVDSPAGSSRALGMGHAVAASLVGRALFSGLVWASRIHRHLAVDRSHAPAFGDLADQPHLAQSHGAVHPPGPAAGA